MSFKFGMLFPDGKAGKIKAYSGEVTRPAAQAINQLRLFE
jgi:hypothetical protein